MRNRLKGSRKEVTLLDYEEQRTRLSKKAGKEGAQSKETGKRQERGSGRVERVGTTRCGRGKIRWPSKG